MHTKILLAIVMLGLGFLPVSAAQFTGTGFTGTLEYTVLTVNSDGTPLTDLDRTEWRTGNDLDGFGSWIEVAATSPNGGETIVVQDVTIPVPAGQVETTGRIHIRACDNAGQRGAALADNCSGVLEITREIDTLPPADLQ